MCERTLVQSEALEQCQVNLTWITSVLARTQSKWKECAENNRLCPAPITIETPCTGEHTDCAGPTIGKDTDDAFTPKESFELEEGDGAEELAAFTKSFEERCRKTDSRHFFLEH